MSLIIGMEPFFSIVIPNLNSGKKLSQCVRILLSQNFRDFEILIMDGNSTDDSLSIGFLCEDKRVQIHKSQDRGVYDAMNKGLKLARGKWVYFLGADDELMDELVLSDVYEFALLHKAKVIYGNVRVEGDTSWARDGEIYAGKFSYDRLCLKSMCHQSIFYDLDFLLKNKITYNLKYPISADWDFNLRCWRSAPFQYFPRVIARFRAGGISSGRGYEPFHVEKVKYYSMVLRLRILVSKIKKKLLGSVNYFFDQMRHIFRNAFHLLLA